MRFGWPKGKDTGLRCYWCGKRIGGGKFCTGTHYNLYVARFGRQPETAASATKRQTED